MMAGAFVYVIAADRGRHKVGYSIDPDGRCAALQRAGGPSLSVVHAEPVLAELADAAERHAHHLIRSTALGNEWFAVSMDEAVAAVKNGVGLALAGEPPPPRLRLRLPEQHDDLRPTEATQFQVRIPRELALRARRIAKDQERTVASLIKQGLKELLKRHSVTDTDPPHEHAA